MNFDTEALARQFAGQPPAASKQPVSLPADLNTSNLEQFGATPAGKAMLRQLLQRIRRGQM